MRIQSPIPSLTQVSPSNDAAASSQPAVCPCSSSTVISASAGSTMLRVLSVCGAIGVSRIREASGETIGPPAERLYPVDPVGVEMMMPSAL